MAAERAMANGKERRDRNDVRGTDNPQGQQHGEVPPQRLQGGGLEPLREYTGYYAVGN